MKLRPLISVVIVVALAVAAALLFAQLPSRALGGQDETPAAQPAETDGDQADQSPPAETDADVDAADETDNGDQPADDDQPAADEVGLDGQAAVDQLGEGFAATVEALGDGEIDWTTGHVTATGVSPAKGATAQDIAMAKRAARLIAARNAILTIAQIRVGSGNTLGDISSGQISVDAVLADFEELSAEFDEQTGAATVRLRAPLCGASGVISLDGVRLARRDAWLWPDGLPAGSSDAVDGVVIDARHVAVTPAALPAFITESGESLFDVTQLSADERTGRCLAVYVRRDAPREGPFGPLRQARAVVRQAGSADAELVAAAGNVFDNPLVLSAVETADGEPSTLVLSAAAVRDLMISGEARRCFRQGRVIIVIDTEDD